MNVPPALTKCADCGCCYAELYAGDDPICWACDAGETCKTKSRPKPSPQPQPSPQPAPAVQEKHMVASAVGRGNRIPDDVRAAIIAAAPTVSNMDLARKYGVSDPSVSTIRRKAGIVLARGPRAKTAPKPSPSRVAVARKPELVSMPEPSGVVVVLNFSAEQLDAIWALLPIDVRGIAIRAALQAKVDAA